MQHSGHHEYVVDAERDTGALLYHEIMANVELRLTNQKDVFSLYS